MSARMGTTPHLRKREEVQEVLPSESLVMAKLSNHFCLKHPAKWRSVYFVYIVLHHKGHSTSFNFALQS